MADKVKVLLVDGEDSQLLAIKGLLDKSELIDYELEHIIAYDVALRIIKQAYHDVYLVVCPQEHYESETFFSKALKMSGSTPFIFLGESGEEQLDIQLLRDGAEDFLALEGLTGVQLERAIRYSIVRMGRVRELNEFLTGFCKLSGEIPMCANCGKLKNEEGKWQEILTYIKEHTDLKFSHGLCHDCADKLYGSQKWYKDDKGHSHTF